MPIAIDEHDFADAGLLAQALARDVANNLRAGLAARMQAVLAVSGGNTPRRFLEQLSCQSLDWARVTVTLTDERWVPADDLRSNERLLRETLLRDAAAAARFVSLYTPAATPEGGYAAIAANVAKLSLPFDAVVLGMGSDGHCASLFADGDHIDAALQPYANARVMPIHTPSVAEPRMTLTLAALVATRALYLHIEGVAKKDILARIVRGDPQLADAPIGSVLQHAPVTPARFWCP